MVKYELVINWTWQEFATEDRNRKTGLLLVEQDVRIAYTFSDDGDDGEILITSIHGLSSGNVVFPLPEWARVQAAKTLPGDAKLQQRMEEAGWTAVCDGRAACDDRAMGSASVGGAA